MRELYIIILALVTFSCDIDQQKEAALTILADRTDAHILNPEVDDIRALIDLDRSPNMGVNIYFQNLGNVDYSPLSTIAIASFSLLDNELQRKSNIKRFYSEIDSLVVRENARSYDFNNSSILYPLINHLKKLNSSGATKKQLLLYSDLMEFSDIYDSYAGRDNLLKDSKAIGEKLRSSLDIPNLEGVTLFLMYYPETIEQNRLFRAWHSIYRELFNESGLEIYIGINQISS